MTGNPSATNHPGTSAQSRLTNKAPSPEPVPYAHSTARVMAKATSAQTETRAIETFPPQRPTSHPLPVHTVQGRCLISAPPSCPSRTSPAPILESQTHPNLDDIMCVCAINFTQFCKQKGVKVMRIYMAELAELVEQEECRQLLEELPTGLVEVPSLSEESFHWLVEGDYTIEEARKALTSYLHDFYKTNHKT